MRYDPHNLIPLPHLDKLLGRAGVVDSQFLALGKHHALGGEDLPDAGAGEVCLDGGLGSCCGQRRAIAATSSTVVRRT